MYPSTFYQPFCHASQPSRQSSYVLSVEPTCYSSPSVFDLQQLVSHQTRQRRAAQVAAHCRAREREDQRRLALERERERALEQERRRRILARRREYERQLARKEEEQAAIRAYYHADRQARLLAHRLAEQEQEREYEAAVSARRENAERQEETSFAAFINSLFHDDPMADAVEDGESTEASEVSADEDEDEDQGPNMSSLLDCLFPSMGVSDNKSPIVGDSPSEEQTVATTSTEEPVVEAEAQPSSEDAAGIAPDDIQQQYAQHQARVERLETLDTLQSKLERLTSSFIFPTSLDFQQQPNTDGTHVVPSLDYTSTNTPYHAHAQSLLGLLVDADGVSSDGDQEIRRRRKEFVLRVEAELDGLEREKERVWRAMAEGGR